MHTIAVGSPTRPPAVPDHATADRDREAQPSRVSLLLEALAYAGASVDPIAALAARRFARIRDEAASVR